MKLIRNIKRKLEASYWPVAGNWQIRQVLDQAIFTTAESRI